MSETTEVMSTVGLPSTLAASSGDGQDCGALSCKWCARPFGILLPRRRDRGAECRTCPTTITEEFPEDSQNKAEFARAVASTPDLQSSIREKSEIIEADVKAGRRGRGIRATANGAGKRTVQRVQQSGMEMRTPRGVFWPEAIYSMEEHFNNKVPKKLKNKNILKIEK